MVKAMSRPTSIVEASAAVLREDGMLAWSLETVADRARCAKGLLLYHFRSKAGLLAATAEYFEVEQSRRRLIAAAGDGAATLDRLFQSLVADVQDGWFAARAGLASVGIVGPRSKTGLAARLAISLGVPTAVLEESEQAIESMLDGLSLSLLVGTDVGLVREAYDRLWLGLLT